MGHGQNLSRDKRAQAIALQESGLSERQIATQLGCSRGAVRNALSRFRETGSHKDRMGRGRQLLSSRRENRFLLRSVLQGRRRTLRELQVLWRAGCGVHASKSTISRRWGIWRSIFFYSSIWLCCRHLQITTEKLPLVRTAWNFAVTRVNLSCLTRLKRLGMRSRIARKKPTTSDQIRGRRMAWSRVVQAWTVRQNWSRVIFSDEVSISLNACHGKVRVWRARGEAHDPECTQNPPANNRTTTMFWGCIGIHGPGELVQVQGKINSDAYIAILRDHLPQSVENIFGDRRMFYIFQQDNAPVHSSRATQAWLEQNDVTTMNWPPYSPDLNIIENVWGWIITKLRSDPPTTIAELSQKVFRLWGQITPEYCASLFRSIPHRVRQVLATRGHPTKFWIVLTLYLVCRPVHYGTVPYVEIFGHFWGETWNFHSCFIWRHLVILVVTQSWWKCANSIGNIP